jgi:hypothetical protein
LINASSSRATVASELPVSAIGAIPAEIGRQASPAALPEPRP